MTLDKIFLDSLDQTVAEIKSLSKDELDSQLAISQQSEFAKTIDLLVGSKKEQQNDFE